ncbi:MULTISPECIES: PP2C family protein-serine/threonine phosphatase [unclassified Streptomyces]|uniref:PP2C family protein-serine/threonine phosphatase n=1 Tax=unclassified Streptomyces TaxID=2593676 RepID=UPI001E5E7EAD|nr:GAF domain-containing SpoIIE family protein phosphatase [Streptomyces sp. CB02980]MCB8901085.1 SpoIIE family protein phosphatase [Streptomyces sp. CB02980]
MTVEGALRGAAPHLLLDSLRTSLTQLYAASSADLLLIDYGYTSLRPVAPVQAPAGMPHAPVDAGPVGRVFRTQQPYLFRDVGPTATAYLPVTVRGDRFGVLVVDLPADRCGPETTESLGRVAETLGHALRVADRHTDLYRSTRRTHALSVAGEMQWDTLPGRACAGPAFDLHAHWEPAYTSGGHLLDWSVTEDELLLIVADGVGPGTPAALVSTLALTAIRNARRAGLDLVGQASLTDQALYGQYRGKSTLAALLLRLDLTNGEIEVVDAGSPTLWRIRGAVTERVELDRQLPLGMFEDTVYATQRLRLLHGDRLVFVACGTGEPPAARGYEAADGPVARALARTCRLSGADAPGAVVRALRETPCGAPDAVLVLCLDWRGHGAGSPDSRRDGRPAPPPP